MLPSASLALDRKGLYEPVHGTAPDIAGKNIANPLAAILSMAMMLRHSFDRPDLADRVHRAVGAVLAEGLSHRGHRRAGHHPARHAGDGRRRRRNVEERPDLRL